MPLTLTMMTAAFPPERRGGALGIWAAISGFGVAVGPSRRPADRRPVVALDLLGQRPDRRGSRRRRARARRGPRAAERVDTGGLVLASAGLLGIVYATVRGNTAGWGAASTLGAYGAGAVLLGAFLWWERRSDHPMVPLRLFRSSAFSTANAANFLLAFAMFSGFLMLIQYFAHAGEGPLTIGVHTLFWTAMPMLVARTPGGSGGASPRPRSRRRGWRSSRPACSRWRCSRSRTPACSRWRRRWWRSASASASSSPTSRRLRHGPAAPGPVGVRPAPGDPFLVVDGSLTICALSDRFAGGAPRDLGDGGGGTATSASSWSPRLGGAHEREPRARCSLGRPVATRRRRASSFGRPTHSAFGTGRGSARADPRGPRCSCLPTRAERLLWSGPPPLGCSGRGTNRARMGPRLERIRVLRGRRPPALPRGRRPAIKSAQSSSSKGRPATAEGPRGHSHSSRRSPCSTSACRAWTRSRSRRRSSDGLPARVLLISASTDTPIVYEAVRAGAYSYISKDAGRRDDLRCDRRRCAGRQVLSKKMQADLVRRRARSAGGRSPSAHHAGARGVGVPG